MRRAKVRQMAKKRPIMANATINTIVQKMDAMSDHFAGVITKTEKAIFDSAVELIKKLDIDGGGFIRNTTANLKLLSDIKRIFARRQRSGASVRRHIPDASCVLFQRVCAKDVGRKPQIEVCSNAACRRGEYH